MCRIFDMNRSIVHRVLGALSDRIFKSTEERDTAPSTDPTGIQNGESVTSVVIPYTDGRRVCSMTMTDKTNRTAVIYFPGSCESSNHGPVGMLFDFFADLVLNPDTVVADIRSKYAITLICEEDKLPKR